MCPGKDVQLQASFKRGTGFLLILSSSSVISIVPERLFSEWTPHSHILLDISIYVIMLHGYDWVQGLLNPGDVES